MDKQKIRLNLLNHALALGERANVEITTAGCYATRYGMRGGYKFCLLGALAFAAYRHPILKDVSLEYSTVAEEGETDLFDTHDSPDFVRNVLSLVWELEDIALIETAFEGDATSSLAKRIPLKGNTYTLFGFFNQGQHINTLTSPRDVLLVEKFTLARNLHNEMPDDRERYSKILRNALYHGGVYNPWG